MIKEVLTVTMSLIKMKSKKADMPGWSYIVAMIIGLFVIAFIIWVAVKSGGKQVELLNFFR